MSCNGCRVLRKGCSEDCILRQSLQAIDTAQAQANATVFAAKFFGRASLMSFISAVPRDQRPSLFQSLLFEAVGRAINPVSGAVGLVCTGNWHVCQAAVTTVLHGSTLQEFDCGVPGQDYSDDVSEWGGRTFRPGDHLGWSGFANSSTLKRKRSNDRHVTVGPSDLDLRLTHPTVEEEEKRRRAATPSEESETTTSGSRTTSGGDKCDSSGGKELLRLFV